MLNNYYYNKSYIRSILLNHKRLRVLDNNFSFLSIDNSKLPKILLSENKVGNSLNTKGFVFKSTLNNDLKFSLEDFNFIGREHRFLNDFSNVLNNIYTKENKFKTLIILYPIKGGFYCYSQGIFGFLPRSHATFFFNELVYYIFKKYNKLSNFIFFEFFKNKKFIENNFIFRFSDFLVGNVSVYPGYKKNNFSTFNFKKSKVFDNNLNIVFLSKKKKYFDTLQKYEKNKTANKYSIIKY